MLWRKAALLWRQKLKHSLSLVPSCVVMNKPGQCWKCIIAKNPSFHQSMGSDLLYHLNLAGFFEWSAAKFLTWRNICVWLLLHNLVNFSYFPFFFFIGFEPLQAESTQSSTRTYSHCQCEATSNKVAKTSEETFSTSHFETNDTIS